ncbi:zinc finger protein 771-like isoform X3 [Labrus bergylta]|uniref:zinc finger protein 771-like isoform X3 n=1 Tax=Labrus bergylta TaxID=56723 RepID=UPI0033141765
MADKLPLPRLLVTARPKKEGKNRKTEAEKAVTRRRLDKTRVNIGTAFQRWRQLRELKGLRSDAVVALFLLDSYEKQTSTPWKPGLLRPPPPAGSAVPAESLSDQDDDLSVAPEDTFELFEKRIAEYEEELRHFREENERQHKLLDAVFNPEVRLHRADVLQLVVSQDEVSPEQQELSPRLDQNDPPNSPQIKDEQKELWGRQEGELQVEEEFDISMLRLKHIPVKREEEDGEKLQSSQLHENQIVESRDTEHLKIEADGEDCGGAEPDLNPDNHLQPVTPDKTSHFSGSDTDDSGEWEESDDPQEGLHARKKFICSICKKCFSSRAAVVKHMRTHTGEKPFKCSFCGKRFAQNGHLKFHMAVHTGEKPFMCSVCGERYARNGDLRRHLAVHTEEKPFSCSVCGKKFAQNGDLKRHLAVHTGEKPFSCSICGKRFAQNGHLRLHLIVHTGEKPFSCSVCGKQFTQNGHLKRHLVVHTRNKTFGCSVCCKKFSRLDCAKRHRLVCERRKNLNA